VKEIDLPGRRFSAYTQLIDQGSTSSPMCVMQTHNYLSQLYGKLREGDTVQGKDANSLTENHKVEKQKVLISVTFLLIGAERPV
jgi:hypothetical protein